MVNPAGSFIWYELMTDDVAGAARFYQEVLGWKVVSSGVKFVSG